VSTAFERLREDGPDPRAESEAIFGAGKGLTTLAPDAGGERVPWARDAESIVVPGVGCFAREAVEIKPGHNLAGEPRDRVRFDADAGGAAFDAPADVLALRSALARTAVMAHALDAVAEMTIAYAREREQFGRPIARFQAVQEHLVTVAQQAALTSAAYELAARREGAFEIAAAKLVANRAATIATRAAHQVHGARGTTREYPLHELTRRLWAWRSEDGDERYWSTRLGAAVARAGAERLYPAITGGSTVVEV
jgi:acyl-CoA dehydrogenase